MKRLFAAILLVSSLGFASSWDGTKGNITLLTYTYNTCGLPGVPSLPPPCTWYSMFMLWSSDSSTSAFRVTVRYTSDGATLSKSITATKNEAGEMTLVPFAVSAADIVGVLVEEFKPGSSQEFLSSGK